MSFFVAIFKLGLDGPSTLGEDVVCGRAEMAEYHAYCPNVK